MGSPEQLVEMPEALRQTPFTIRLDWGLDGAEAIGRADVAVVVDVLSFSTCVTVAADAGITVLPYRWTDDGAADFAASHDATLAVRRSEAGPGQISLSPGSIRIAHDVARLVLPSPNGSTIASHLLGQGGCVLAGCVRNAGAVARWLTDRFGADGATVAVVAAGERWPSGRLRPAVEDLWGAGALVAALQREGWVGVSPEADAAASAFSHVRADLPARLAGCSSGAELLALGYADDVAIAAELNESGAVPLLGESGFRDASLRLDDQGTAGR